MIWCAGVRSFQADPAPHELGLEDVEHCLDPLLGLASISMAWPDQRMLASVFLKSNRCRTSLAAWFNALSTSWRSTLLTMSNELSATLLLHSHDVDRPIVSDRLARPAGGWLVVVELGIVSPRRRMEI